MLYAINTKRYKVNLLYCNKYTNTKRKSTYILMCIVVYKVFYLQTLYLYINDRDKMLRSASTTVQKKKHKKK